LRKAHGILGVHDQDDVADSVQQGPVRGAGRRSKKYALVCFGKDDERMRIAIAEELGVGRYKGLG
jgi:hypothetical protein